MDASSTAEQVGTKEQRAHLPWLDQGAARGGHRTAPQQVDEFAQKDRGQSDWPDPDPGRQPVPLLLDGGPSSIEHDEDEDEQHHDRTGVDDDFEGCREGSAENIEDDRHCQERDDEAEQRMHHVEVDNHQRGGNNGNSRSYVEGDRHGVLKRFSLSCRFSTCGSE